MVPKLLLGNSARKLQLPVHVTLERLPCVPKLELGNDKASIVN